MEKIKSVMKEQEICSKRLANVPEIGRSEINGFFCVNVQSYVHDKNFNVYVPSSVSFPRDNSVMFLMGQMEQKKDVFFGIRNCLIFWDEKIEVPCSLEENHAVVKTANPRLEYCRFFADNHIKNFPEPESFQEINGALICDGSKIGKGTTVMPGCYIGGNVIIGQECYIGTGVRIVGIVHIGNNVVIRENTVIGADGLTTDRDADGTAVTMPQFGGVVIEDNVQIGANTVIARGAIDNTVLEKGCKIDNSSFISHNVQVGQDTFIVGETILFGSSRIGRKSYISGNSTVRNKVVIGDGAFVGMGAVVTKNVENGITVVGNPARKR